MAKAKVMNLTAAEKEYVKATVQKVEDVVSRHEDELRKQALDLMVLDEVNKKRAAQGKITIDKWW